MRGSSRAFTLIELMISIALIAIFLATAVNRCTLCWLHRESHYRFALRNARHQVGQLRDARFDSLPPQTLQVGPDGWVQLAHTDLVPNSLQVLGSDVPVEDVQTAPGRVRLGAAPGSRVSLSYAYYLPDRGEAHTVPTVPPYRVALANTPVVQINQVRLVVGDGLQPLPSSAYQGTGSFLELGPALAGKVIEVDYAGESVRNQVSGTYLDANLQPIMRAGPYKRVTVREAYGPQGTGRIELDLIKAADKP